MPRKNKLKDDSLDSVTPHGLAKDPRLSIENLRLPGGIDDAVSWIVGRAFHSKALTFDATLHNLSSAPDVLVLLLTCELRTVHSVEHYKLTRIHHLSS